MSVQCQIEQAILQEKVNEIGETDFVYIDRWVCEPWYFLQEDVKELFPKLEKQYGKATSNVYQDYKDGTTKCIGWVFSIQREENTFEETWVTLREVTPFEVEEIEPA